MRRLIAALVIGGFCNIASAQGGVITVEQFLRECQADREPCMAFVMGVIEGARHQTREHLKASPTHFSCTKNQCVYRFLGVVKL